MTGTVRALRRSSTLHLTTIDTCALWLGRVAKLVEIGGAGPEVAWWGGSGGEVKLGGGAVEGGPAIDPSHGDLTRGEERPEQHGGGLGTGQQALGPTSVGGLAPGRSRSAPSTRPSDWSHNRCKTSRSDKHHHAHRSRKAALTGRVRLRGPAPTFTEHLWRGHSPADESTTTHALFHLVESYNGATGELRELAPP